MKLDNTWKYLYKIDYQDNTLCKTNLLYTPYVNNDGSILCIDYSPNFDYQKSTEVSNELIEFFFKKELKYLQEFQGKPWAPTILDINGQKIYIEFNSITLNQILMSGQDLSKVLPDWKDQLSNIIVDIDSMGYYKLALYPHSFFISNNNQLKVLDFYTFLEKSSPYISRKFIQGMIGKLSENRFNEATVGENIDFRIFFKQSLTTHLAQYWKVDNPFPEIYKSIIARN